MKDPTPEEQGARSRNAVPSVARNVPLIISPFTEPTAALGIFYVSKVQLEEGLKFVAEGHDAEQRQARLRQLFSRLIATSDK